MHKVMVITGMLKAAPSIHLRLSAFTPNIQCFSTGVTTANSLKQVTVIGSGHMGTGIAQVSAAAGNLVTVADIQEDALKNSKAKIEQRLLKFSKKTLKDESDPAQLTSKVEAVMSRIIFTTDIPKSVEHCDLVVEAVKEQLDVKQKLFSMLDETAPSSAIFVTNTSSIPVGEIAERLSGSRKQRFGGVHFFNAVLMKLVEVIRIPETSEESFITIMNWSKFIGKVPVAAKDTPGFIVNRLNIPFYLQAIAMYERGDATTKDIDTAMKLGAGYPYGPFELSDNIGLDVMHDILQGWEKRFPDNPAYRCPETIKRLYKEGKWGMKTGEGFFKYSM